jgi:hypothetical protein
VRDSRLTDHGMYAAQDSANGLTIILVDASFYSLEVFKRTGTSFVADATAAMTAEGIRAIVNGQFFKPGGTGNFWQGEIVKDGTLETSSLTSAADAHLINWITKTGNDGDGAIAGQWAGRTEKAVMMGSFVTDDTGQKTRVNLPSRITAAGKPEFQHALSGVMSLIFSGVPTFPFSTSNSSDATGSNVWSSSADGYYKQNFSFRGKIVYGIDRGKQLLFFLGQAETWTSTGFDFIELQGHLIENGRDSHGVSRIDAVFGDGGTSVAILVDDATTPLISPILNKDEKIPTGLALRLTTHSLDAGITDIESCNDSTLNAFLAPFQLVRDDGATVFRLSGGTATATWTASGLSLEISAYGEDLENAWDSLGIGSLPDTLDIESGTDLVAGVTFKSDDGSGLIVTVGDPNETSSVLSCLLQVSDESDPGTLTAPLTIEKGSVRLTGTITWSVSS